MVENGRDKRGITYLSDCSEKFINSVTCFFTFMSGPFDFIGLTGIFLIAGVKSIAGCFLSPMATGMSLVLCMLTLKQDRPRAKYVLWPRIDQKSSFKSIITAGLEPIVIEMQIIGDELKTDMQRLEAQMAALGESVACVLTTTSCFAPRACDSVDAIAALCSQYNIPHLVNNAYG